MAECGSLEPRAAYVLSSLIQPSIQYWKSPSSSKRAKRAKTPDRATQEGANVRSEYVTLITYTTKCSTFENPSSKGAKTQNEYVLSSLRQPSIQHWKTLAARPKIARKPKPIRRKHLLNNLALQLTSGLP